MSALNGLRPTVVLPKLTQQPDYESEFAFVIGKRGKDISADRWQEHVFCYTIMNRKRARHSNVHLSMLVGEELRHLRALGPAIVTKDEIPDPHSLDIKLTIGGELLQHSNTRELIFRISRPHHLYLLHHSASNQERSSARELLQEWGLAVHLIAGCGRARPSLWRFKGSEELINR
jgi:Fumarylacetoacetate (FAA) hydrolase family